MFIPQRARASGSHSIILYPTPIFSPNYQQVAHTSTSLQYPKCTGNAIKRFRGKYRDVIIPHLILVLNHRERFAQTCTVRSASCVFVTTELRNFSQNHHFLSGSSLTKSVRCADSIFYINTFYRSLGEILACSFRAHVLNIGCAELDSENAHDFFLYL
jgi:hypothetical protein